MTTNTGDAIGREPSNTPASEYDTRFAHLERRLERTIPADQEALVRAALAANDVIWAARDTASVPDGTEPAFVFIPTRLPARAAVAHAREECGHE